jgi:hypothetical protein
MNAASAFPFAPERTKNPEAQLWLSVLLEALNTASGGGSNLKERDRKAARRWFARRQEGQPLVGTFPWVCEVLELGYEETRTRAIEHIRSVLRHDRENESSRMTLNTWVDARLLKHNSSWFPA